MEQRTDEWFAARLGKVTASRLADVTAKTRTGWGASRKNYMAQLTAEILTGTVAPSFTNAAMQHGIDTEPEAIAVYEFFHDVEVTPVGFIDHPRVPRSGASPDGLIGADGLIEVKCPNTATHIETLIAGEIPKKYLLQMLWQMACTGRKWCDFASFDPRMPEHMQLFVRRIERDDKEITELEKSVRIFIDALDEQIAELTKRYGEKA